MLPEENGQTFDYLFSDPLIDLDFIRSDDYYVSDETSPVFDPSDIIIKYYSDPTNNQTNLFIDRKYKVNGGYSKNISWTCQWNSNYSDNSLTFYLYVCI